MYICNDADMARLAIASGVNRIFVDLEKNGKYERQGHRDTLISDHTIEDVAAVRRAIVGEELLVRLNPQYSGSEQEIEDAIFAGADIIMLPMFTRLSEIEYFISAIDGRCKFIPLIETPEAVQLVSKLIHLTGVDELYVGLNDLHLALDMNFMFELLIDGTVEGISSQCRSVGMPFGFGGIARIGEGMLSGELVLAEHKRLGSDSVILSRTFHRSSTSLDDMRTNLDFKREIQKLRECENNLLQRDGSAIEKDVISLKDCIIKIAGHKVVRKA